MLYFVANEANEDKTVSDMVNQWLVGRLMMTGHMVAKDDHYELADDVEEARASFEAEALAKLPLTYEEFVEGRHKR